VITLALDGRLGELERLASEVERFCREQGLDDEVRFDLNLALEELFINALRHGGCLGMEHAAEVRLALEDDGVGVEFQDRGAAFDPASAPAPDPARVGGLGLHLVRGIMQEIEYERAGEWNRIRMRRAVKPI